MAVMDIGRFDAGAVDQATGAIHADMQLHAEVHWFLFLVCCISGSRVLSRFLTEGGAAISVASTMVPISILIHAMKAGPR